MGETNTTPSGRKRLNTARWIRFTLRMGIGAAALSLFLSGCAVDAGKHRHLSPHPTGNPGMTDTTGADAHMRLIAELERQLVPRPEAPRGRQPVRSITQVSSAPIPEPQVTLVFIDAPPIPTAGPASTRDVATPLPNPEERERDHPLAPVSSRASHLYTVQWGDTLWDLSKMFLGNATQWPRIWDANPKVKNPDLILAGNTLTIPVQGSDLAPIRTASAPPDRRTILASAHYIRGLQTEIKHSVVGPTAPEPGAGSWETTVMPRSTSEPGRGSPDVGEGHGTVPVRGHPPSGADPPPISPPGTPVAATGGYYLA